MKHSTRLGGLVVAVPLVAAGWLPAAAAAAPQTIKFTAVQYQQSQHGKTFSFKEHLLSGGKSVGHDSVTCTQTGHAHDLACLGTFVLSKGTLRVKVVIVSQTAKVNHGTVTGGTGSYAGAKGSVTLTNGTGNRTGVVIGLT